MKEIIAKKFRQRGDKQTARDLFDFALVPEKEPNEFAAAARFVVRHIDTMFEQLELYANRLKLQFETIDALRQAQLPACGEDAERANGSISKAQTSDSCRTSPDEE